MVEAYYYLPSKEADEAVECGLKLSRWYDKEVVIHGDSKKCISALLNPRDDIEKYKSPDYKCVKFELASQYCYAADKYLYRVGLRCPQVMELYRNSVMPVEKYVFGLYRLPECLVTCTVITDQLHVLRKMLGPPILFGSSEELYVNNIIESYKEEYKDFNDTMLYYLYCKLAEEGIFDRMEDAEKKVAIFVDKGKGRVYTIKVPDIELWKRGTGL